MPDHELLVYPGGRIYKTNSEGEYTAELPPLEDVTIKVRDPVSRQIITRHGPFRIKEGEVIEENLKVGEPPSKLVNQSLPDFDGVDIDFDIEQAKGERLLVCLWDMEQRPSRNCVKQLATRADKLKRQGITVVGIQVSAVDKNDLNGWVRKNRIPFPVGIVQGNGEKIRSTWDVRSLPWLILTDRTHLVLSDGFNVGELDSQL
jgi:hypothetical protein